MEYRPVAGGKTENLEKNPRARAKTNNKLSPHVVPGARFLKVPLTGPKSFFEIKVLKKVGHVLTCNKVDVVSLADNFTV